VPLCPCVLIICTQGHKGTAVLAYLSAMNRVILFLSILLIACNGNPKNYLKAENALDAGREFIDACLQGDFSRASYLMVQNEKNIGKLKEIQGYYRQKDKEGRQQYRLASITINEVEELNADSTLIRYSNTFDKTPEVLLVLKQPDGWLVDLSVDKKIQ
jgi:hypothetical protein